MDRHCSVKRTAFTPAHRLRACGATEVEDRGLFVECLIADGTHGAPGVRIGHDRLVEPGTHQRPILHPETGQTGPSAVMLEAFPADASTPYTPQTICSVRAVAIRQIPAIYISIREDGRWSSSLSQDNSIVVVTRQDPTALKALLGNDAALRKSRCPEPCDTKGGFGYAMAN